MTHTPGPWEIAYEDDEGVPYDNGVRIDSPEGPVAFNVIDCSADLIAAAPDLLKALKDVVGRMEMVAADMRGGLFGHDFGSATYAAGLRRCHERAAAVIEKAKGGAV